MSGSAVWYFPYGEARPGSGNPPTDYRFTGQRFESMIGGLYDYGARFYDPVLGRFVSADTVVPQAGHPQALNRYAYVLNNPLKYTDPTGHAWDPGGPTGGKPQNAAPQLPPATQSPPPPPPPPPSGSPIVDWRWLVDWFLPARSDATVHSLGVSAGVLKFTFCLSADLVSTKEGDVMLFVTVPDTGKARSWLMCESDCVFPLYTPQAGIGVMKGSAYGKDFERKGAIAYEGPFLTAAAGAGEATANVFMAFDENTGRPSTAVVGYEAGYARGVPNYSASVNATYSIPIKQVHVKLEGWQVAVVRWFGGCGR